MKTVLPLLISILLSLFSKAQSSKDLPSPTANLQTLAAGSYVIPMDNTLQLNTAGNFNLKAYGLVVHLLNNNVKVKWAIRAGKTKDGADFSGTGVRILPTTTAIPSVYNFLAGPFVIAAADTSGVAALVSSFYSGNGLTGNDRPAVYRLTVASFNVDIRYDLTGFKPKAAILTDGSNTMVHWNYMIKAAIPVANYDSAKATDLIRKCYTFASEPHIDVISSSNVNAVRSFVRYGGNFLAQCEAVLAYENSSVGRFQTTNGITKVNTVVAASSTIYPNPDLAYSQFQGVFDINSGGSVRNWVLSAASSFQNNAHNHSSGGTLAAQSPIGASVAKLNISSNAGGLIYYLGSHEFSSITSLASINGIRMYMNALLTPTTLNMNCTLGATLLNVLPVKPSDFTVAYRNEKAELTWNATKNESIKQFTIERSFDGRSFSKAGTILAVSNSNEVNTYKFNDPLNSLQNTVIHYRIRSEYTEGKFDYSETRVIRTGNIGTNISVSTYPNPATNQIHVVVPGAWNGKLVKYDLVDQSGRVVYQKETVAGSFVEIIDADKLQKGFYILKASCNAETATQKISKQ